MLNIEFWRAVAGAWDRTITLEESRRVVETAAQLVERATSELNELGTNSTIPSALDAILGGNDDELW